MLNRFCFTFAVVLFASSLQAQSSESLEDAELQVVEEAGVSRSAIIEFAKKHLGISYQYGSLDPAKGFDCSGFVHFVFKHFDISLPRTSRQYDELGAAQNPDEFKVGDVLVFYGFSGGDQIGHVGIVCEANGLQSKFIHASSGKANGITISQLDIGQYARRFYKCIDVIRQINE